MTGHWPCTVHSTAGAGFTCNHYHDHEIQRVLSTLSQTVWSPIWRAHMQAVQIKCGM